MSAVPLVVWEYLQHGSSLGGDGVDLEHQVDEHLLHTRSPRLEVVTEDEGNDGGYTVWILGKTRNGSHG